MIQEKKILILGMARSGVSAAKLLSKYNNNITITDMKEQDDKIVKELEDLGIKVVISTNQEELVDSSYDLMVKNPAIPKDNKAVLKAKDLNISVINEVEVGYSFLPKDVKIVAITGSNGKTTTTTMVYDILKKAYGNVHLGGNIGIPLCNLVENVKEKDILVLEISDHQLLDMDNFTANISILTNLSQVHLDFHGNYENYKLTKKRIFNNHTENSIAILNQENEDVMNLTKDIVSKKIYFSSKNPSDAYINNNTIIYNGEEIINLSDIRLKGIHNYENIMVAIIVSKIFNVNNKIIKNFLKEFKGVEHRLEFVGEIKGRKFYNDSKSTNNVSTITALKSFTEPIILIMGGLDRNIPFDELSPYLDHVKHIICYGETKDKIEDFAKKNNIFVNKMTNLIEASKKAYEVSREGDIILLSPACASWDQYPNFETRGEEFKSTVNTLV